MNPIEQLHNKLDKAGIPHAYKVVKNPRPIHDYERQMYGDKAKYMRNQIMYPDSGDGICKFDAIWQYGALGGKDQVETYHELGCSEDGDVRTMSVDEAFDIIFKDWTKNHPGVTLLNGEPVKEDI